MDLRLFVAHDRACTAVARISGNNVDVNSKTAEWLAYQSGIRAADKSDENHLAAQLSKHACGIAALASRLNDDGPASLNFSRLEMVDFENAVDGQIGTDDEEHARFYC